MMDSQRSTCSDVTKNQKQKILQMSSFIKNLLNLIQDLGQRPVHDYLIVFFGRLVGILSRYYLLFGLRFQNIFKTIDFEHVTEYEKLREIGYVGFAHVYLVRRDKESKAEDIADVQLYTKLVELDTRLGTTATEQLFWCLYNSLRLDLIKV